MCSEFVVCCFIEKMSLCKVPFHGSSVIGKGLFIIAILVCLLCLLSITVITNNSLITINTRVGREFLKCCICRCCYLMPLENNFTVTEMWQNFIDECLIHIDTNVKVCCLCCLYAVNILQN